jgi:2-polyprenyl-6-methoxyphenol hydroxylase-like FAD-dependent oxidoreductase
MTAREKSPILIVGAGVTGLMLGCVLRRHGAPVRIVDKLPGIRPFARAVGVHSRSLEIFQDLGIVDALIAKAEKVAGYRQFAEGRCIQHVRYDDLDAPYPFLAVLEQWKTEGLLEEKLAELGGAVERETELMAIEERLDGVRATLRLADGSTEIADVSWLVGCDGAHSTVRHLNRQHFPGEADPRRYLIADVIVDAPYGRGEIIAFLSDIGALFWGPLPEGRTLVFGDYEQGSERIDGEPTLEDLRSFVDSRCVEHVEIRDPRWIGLFHVNYRLTPHYRHGRTILAGDAAHIHSSVGGQGMNTGMQDAYNLGWKLALVSQGRAPESLLDSYEKERRAVAADVLAMSRAMSEQAFSYSKLPAEERARSYAHAYVPEAERLRSIRKQEELDLDYRKSPICMEYRHSPDAEGQPAGAPHAGAEAVDAGPLEVDGRRVTAFELFAGPQHTLLLFVGADGRDRRHASIVDLAGEVARVHDDLIRVCILLPADADAAVFKDVPATLVRDLEGRMHERYGAAAGRSYLIRPDGYIGWCSERPSLTAFRDYLANVLVCP